MSNENNEFILKENESKIIIENKETNVLKGNDKRKASCKKIGGEKKEIGHKREKDFLKQYNITEINSPLEYGAKSDTSIDLLHPICEILKEQLNVSTFNVSNKSGNNIQFTLGQIPELKDIEIEEFNNPIFTLNLFNKYLNN